MKPPSRLVGLQAGRSRYGEQAERIAAFFLEPDPLADDAVHALARLPAERSHAMLSPQALEQGSTAVPDAPEAVHALFRRVVPRSEHKRMGWGHANWDRFSMPRDETTPTHSGAMTA